MASEPVETVEGPPPAPPPTPLDPPQVFFAAGSNYPPRVVRTQEEADALDKAAWISAAIAPAPEPGEEAKYPQVWFNVNVPPKIVATAEEAKALGPDWRQLKLPEPKEE
jgi:hypothetical protein